VSAHVAWISIAPVKGLGLVHPDEVLVERIVGVSENRRFHLVDDAGRLANGKRFGPLVQVRPEIADGELALHFPDGTVTRGEVRLGPPAQTSFYGRPVAGHVVEGPFGEALSELAGIPVRLVRADQPGAAVDRGTRGAVSLLSQAALEQLNPDSPLDGRRFRMLFGIGGVPAHAEDGWIDRPVRIGGAVVVPRGHVGRCLVTSQNPDTGRPDFDTLGALRDQRGGLESTEPLPFGVYATVLNGGRVRLGDPVEA
jgi:uncharacterized protein YcbX